jgi:PAS domain S-box-containing protein
VSWWAASRLTAHEAARLTIFMSIGLFISALNEALHRASAALNASLSRTNDILESIHDAFFMLDHEGRFRYVNHEAEKIWNRRREDLLGRKVKEVFPQADGSEALRAVEKSLADRTPACIETLGPISGRWVEVRIRPVEDGVSVYFRDISVHKQLEKELTRRVEQRTTRLKEVNDELDTFTYSASHDLRAPIRKILSYCDLLTERVEPALSAEECGWFRRIRSSAEHMDRLVDEMQNLAEATQRELKRETVDLSALANRLFEAQRRAAPERRVDCVIAPGLTALADPHLLWAVVHNLIDNAWKFTALTELAHIEFASSPSAGGPVFFVKDNGAGFDMANSSTMFKAFERLHEANEFPGKGVGLAIAHRIIRRHGGEIWAESRLGEGAVFYFTLPPETA